MIKITPSDYLEFTGIDLAIELRRTPSDNIEKQPQIFINRTSEFLKEYINENFAKQKYQVDDVEDVYKRAILYQMQYFIEHGNLSLYNPDKLPVLSPNAYRVLKSAGLANGIL